jgi:hypothetical protein
MASLEKVWLALGLLAFAIAHIWGASLMPMSDNKQPAQSWAWSRSAIEAHFCVTLRPSRGPLRVMTS